MYSLISYSCATRLNFFIYTATYTLTSLGVNTVLRGVFIIKEQWVVYYRCWSPTLPCKPNIDYINTTHRWRLRMNPKPWTTLWIVAITNLNFIHRKFRKAATNMRIEEKRRTAPARSRSKRKLTPNRHRIPMCGETHIGTTNSRNCTFSMQTKSTQSREK